MILFTAVPGVILIYQLAVVNALNIRVSLASFMYSCSIGDIHVFNQKIQNQ
jgi:hypothetical protein